MKQRRVIAALVLAILIPCHGFSINPEDEEAFFLVEEKMDVEELKLLQ